MYTTTYTTHNIIYSELHIIYSLLYMGTLYLSWSTCIGVPILPPSPLIHKIQGKLYMDHHLYGTGCGVLSRVRTVQL